MKKTLLLLACLLAATPAFAEATFEEAVSLFEDKNFSEARTIAEALADKNDPRAMTMMGAILQKGLGTDVNIKGAIGWYQKAADLGNIDAQFALAMIYLDASNGNIGPEAVDTGRKLLEEVAKTGRVDAEYNLGLIYSGSFGTDPDWPKAVDYFKKAADQNSVEAQYNLGLLYQEGKGVEKNLVTAADWLSRAAVRGMPQAALEYGVMVMRGDGVQRDENIGRKWLLYAASRGHPVAQNRLARIYASGIGVAVDPVEAAKWNILASKGGRPDPTLDDLMAKLTPEQKKEADKEAAEFVPSEAPQGFN